MLLLSVFLMGLAWGLLDYASVSRAATFPHKGRLWGNNQYEGFKDFFTEVI